MKKNGKSGACGAKAASLVSLMPGELAIIAEVEAEGELKRRLIGLGFFPGERVVKVLESPLGDPAAYLVRGAVTAIRNTDAAKVLVLSERGKNGCENEA